MAEPNSNTLTAERARELLSYDPYTGRLSWKESPRCGKIPSGGEAGFVNNRGYRHVGVDGCTYKTHRVAWLIVTGAWPDDQIDHIDGDRLNNCWDNLRAVSRTENLRNQKRYSNNTSGITGVRWNKKDGKWHARIRVNGTDIHLGNFSALPAAAKARKVAERKYGFYENHGRIKQ